MNTLATSFETEIADASVDASELTRELTPLEACAIGGGDTIVTIH
jgi:hypothetical protein